LSLVQTKENTVTLCELRQQSIAILVKQSIQSKMQCDETVASGCPTEHEVQLDPNITCHHSNRSASDCNQPCNDADIYSLSRNVSPNNDVTDASDCVNCYCAGANALVPLASNQVKCLKQDAEYLEMVALDADDNGAGGDKKPSSRQTNFRIQHNDDYFQLVAYEDYLQTVAYDHYTQLVVNDDCRPQVANDDYLQLVANQDYIQHVALDFRYYGTCIIDNNTVHVKDPLTCSSHVMLTCKSSIKS
jgi:hypothetical protein